MPYGSGMTGPMLPRPHSGSRVPAVVCSLVILVAGGCWEGTPEQRDSGSGSASALQAGKDPARLPAAAPWFTEIAAAVGLAATHDAGIHGAYRFQEIMGAGCALFDFDRDGALDIYFVNGSRPDRRPARGPVLDRLYRQSADGVFGDVTESAGIRAAGYGMGCAVGDYDNDGYPDLFLANFGPDQLWHNNGDGTFTDVTESSGIDNDLWSVSASFFDYDRDGLLDLYVINYLLDPNSASCYDMAGRVDYCGPQNFLPAPDKLFHNQGNGRFRDVSVASGIAAAPGPGLGLVCADLNQDGWDDVYVANDQDRNFLWINRQDGTFEESAILLGCAFDRNGLAEAGMGVAIGDVDSDGLPDLFITHLHNQSNTLYRGSAWGSFIDATDMSGLGMSSATFTGFGTALSDLDHDGDLDLLVVNGAVKRRSWPMPGAEVDTFWQLYAESNLFYLNDGTGRFEDVSARAGPICSRAEVSRGLAVGDIDGDGDLDVLVTAGGGPLRLFRNDMPKKGRWLVVHAVDPALNRVALGAVVRVSAGGRSLQRTVLAGFSYASSSQPIAHFGLGDVDLLDDLTVRWPYVKNERFTGITVDSAVTLYRGAGLALPR